MNPAPVELVVDLDAPVPLIPTDLPPGRYLVDTESDTFDVDTVGRVAIRLDLAAEANGRTARPEPFLFDTVECKAGHALLFDAESSPRAFDAIVGVTRVQP